MAYDIGPKIGIEGEAEFRKELNVITQTLKALDKEMEAVTNSFDANDRSQEKLTQQNKILNQQIDLQKKKLQDLKKGLEDATKEWGENDARTQKWQTSVNQATATLNKMERSLQENESALKQMKNASVQSEQELKDLQDRAEKAKQELNSMANDIKGKVSSGVKTLGTGIAALGAGIVGTVQGTAELRGDLSVLSKNAEEAGVSFDTANNALLDFNAISGETDSSIEAISNLLQAGFSENNLARAVDALSGAVIRFPDTLKIESLADSLQETLATSEATGQYSELLERLGYNLDDFNAGLQQCTTAAEKQEYALDYLAKSGLMETNRAYEDQNQDLIENSKQQLRLQENLAELGGNFAPLVNRAMEALNNTFAELNDTAVPVFVDGLEWLADHGEITISVLAGLTAGVVAYKAAAVVTDAISAFQTMAEAIKAAQAAQTALNIAQMANPIGLTVAAVAGLVTGVAVLANTMDDSGDSVDEFAAEIEKTTQKTEELNETIQSNRQTHEDNMTAIKAEADMNRDLVGELEDLMSAESRSAEEKNRIQGIVYQLNQAIPELNAAYDAQRDKLSLNTKTVEQYIAEKEAQLKVEELEQAMAQNYQSQRDVRAQIAEVEKQITKAKQEQSTAQAHLNYLENQLYSNGGTQMNLTKELTDAKIVLDDANEKLTTLNETQDINKNSLEELEKAYNNQYEELKRYSAATGNAEEATNDMGETTVKVSDEMQKKFEELEKAYSDTLTAAKESINNQIGLFDEINTESDLTFSEMKQRLLDQAHALNNWAENMQIATKKGVRDGLLKELADAGPASAGYLEIIANLTDDEIDALNKAWDERFNASQYAGEEMANVQHKIENQDVIQAAFNSATEAMNQYAAGVNALAWAPTNAVSNTIGGAVNVARNFYSSFYGEGKNAGQGYADGIAAAARVVGNAAYNLGIGALNAVKRAQNSNSPSKEFAKIGGDGAEGYVVGFEGKMSDVRGRITRSTQENLDAAAKAGVSANGVSSSNTLTAKDIAKGIQKAGLKFHVGQREFARLQRRASRNA